VQFSPTPLKLSAEFDIFKMGCGARESVIVAKKKGTEKVQILAGQFAPLSKEDSYKQVQNEIDLAPNGPNKVTQIYVHDRQVFLSTAGTL
jgi:hypothetical protein